MPDLTPLETGAKIVHDARGAAQAILSTATETAAKIVEEANTGPTNAELKESFEAHARADHAFQTMQTEVNETAEKSRISIHKKLNELPTHEETARIVEKVIRDLLLSKGKMVYQGIIVTSILIGALVVIFGGFKTVLGWLGYAAIVK